VRKYSLKLCLIYFLLLLIHSYGHDLWLPLSGVAYQYLNQSGFNILFHSSNSIFECFKFIFLLCGPLIGLRLFITALEHAKYKTTIFFAYILLLSPSYFGRAFDPWGGDFARGYSGYAQWQYPWELEAIYIPVFNIYREFLTPIIMVLPIVLVLNKIIRNKKING